MLHAFVPSHDGQPETLIRADDPVHDKAAFYELAARGLLKCSGVGHDGLRCSAGVTHVSGGFIDGGTSERTSHFRTDDIEQHSKGCDNIDDPRGAQRSISIRRALDQGLPILVNINIALAGVKGGAKLLAPEFNANVNNPASGLWQKTVWLRETAKKHGIAEKDILRVPARDITDVLYYLELAKQYGEAKGGREGAQAALQSLWFNTGHAIQSCSRFVVRDSEAQMSRLVRQFMERARSTPKRADELFDTPRLFLFTVSDAQAKKAEKEVAQQLYGQHYDVDISAPEKPHAEHHIIMAMRMKAEDLDNRRVIQEGRQLWTIAVPAFSRRRAFEMKAKAHGLAPKPVKAGFMFLQVGSDSQIVSTSAPRRIPQTRVKRALVHA